MKETRRLEARLHAAATLSDTLAAGFDAFEAIRQLSRDCEDLVPALFAAFMSTADAAVDGREAIAIAPSLLACGPEPTVTVGTAARSVDGVTDALASLGAVLRSRELSGPAGACSARCQAGAPPSRP